MSYLYCPQGNEFCIFSIFNPIIDSFLGGIIALLLAIIIELKYPEYNRGLKERK